MSLLAVVLEMVVSADYVDYWKVETVLFGYFDCLDNFVVEGTVVFGIVEVDIVVLGGSLYFDYHPKLGRIVSCREAFGCFPGSFPMHKLLPHPVMGKHRMGVPFVDRCHMVGLL